MNKFILVFILIFTITVKSSDFCSDLFYTIFDYPEIVKQLDPNEEHTIEKKSAFIARKISLNLLENAKTAQIEIILGPATSEIKRYFGDNYKSIIREENPDGAFSVWKIEYLDSTVKYFITNVNGESRYIQLLSYLKLAGILEHQIKLHNKMSNYKEIYERTIKEIGEKPSLVVIGFANTLVRELINNGVSEETKQISFDKNTKYTELKWQKHEYWEHELKYLGIQIIKLHSGETIWFIDNEYGDRIVDIKEALEDNDINNILIFGTAAGLNSSMKVGDIIAPETFTYFIGNEIHTEYNWANADALPMKSGTHGDVDSLALETKKWLNKMNQNFISSVEVELTKILRSKKNDSLSAYLVVSDLLLENDGVDYTNWKDLHREKTGKKIFEIFISELNKIKINDLSDLQYKIQNFLIN